MVAKKKITKKKTKPTSKKVTKAKKPAKKKAAKKKPARKPLAKKARPKAKAASKKTSRAKAKTAPRKPVRRKGRTSDAEGFSLAAPVSRAASRSGDLQGLSHVEGADSESVDELLDEGNAFEADVVKGVEDAGNSEGREVHTHEVPEDDVPEEYLDKD